MSSRLASYALQAEFGDHDTEKHTAEYLQDFPLLPKPMMSLSDDRLGSVFLINKLNDILQTILFDGN